MINNVGCIRIGCEFIFDGARYVRIPEMILRCGEHEFVVNSIKVVESAEPTIPPKFEASFIHPDCGVAVL